MVAALTIPTLVNNYQKKQTVVQLRKVFSDLNNVVKLSEVDNGHMSTWVYPSNNTTEVETFIKTYYLPYFKSAEYKTREFFQKSNYIYSSASGQKYNHANNGIVLNNGVILTFQPGITDGYFWIFADLNGMQEPNKLGRDVFVFDGYKFAKSGKYYISFWSPTVSSVKRTHLTSTTSNYSCNKNHDGIFSGYYCGALIQFDGWNISDDYPW